jgi:hypothetical protein
MGDVGFGLHAEDQPVGLVLIIGNLLESVGQVERPAP